MFTICIDSENYYTEGVTEHIVQVSEMPQVTDISYLKAYKYENGILILDEFKLKKIISDNLNEYKIIKINEINNICQESISNGTDITLSDGNTKHFSMTQNDQINILGLTTMIAQRYEQIPYHADGEECTYYSVEDTQTIVNTMFDFKTYHTTYCNLLHMMINECSTKEELDAITYGMELPEDKNSTLQQITGVSSITAKED